MKANPLYVETRSKRVQLLMQPSLHDRLKEEAKKKGVSFNELVNGLYQLTTQGLSWKIGEV